MPKDFDDAAKEILNFSDSAIIPFINANFAAAHPPDVRIIRTNTEYRVPPAEQKSGGKTIIADEIFLVGETDRYHIEIELHRKAGMAIRMFRYDVAEAMDHPTEEDGVQTINFPKSLVIYLEPTANTPDHELLHVRFPDGALYHHRTQVIKLTELTVGELVERHLLIFAPLYILKLRQKLKRTKTPEERRKLAAALKEIYGEIGEAMKREKEAGNMTEVDENKIVNITELLHKKMYGKYNEFKEETMGMGIPERMRLIEKLYAEMDEIKRSRAEIERSFEEERRSREEAVFMAGQRLKDTARNILKAGQSVEQVVQWTGLPRERARAPAAQLWHRLKRPAV
jgi:hypothetical protein